MQQVYNPYQRYRKEKLREVQTADRVHLITLLLEGAIRYNKQALAAKEQNMKVKVLEAVDSAYKVVMHLYNSLDLDTGGAAIENLANLYHFICDEYYQFTKARGKRYLDPKILESINKLLGTILEGWRQLEGMEHVQ